jgi:hypothetical protein
LNLKGAVVFDRRDHKERREAGVFLLRELRELRELRVLRVLRVSTGSFGVTRRVFLFVMQSDFKRGGREGRGEV